MNKKEFQISLHDRDLIGLDSEYTYSTRKLVGNFQADGAHLNKWWVMTNTEWKCPCCNRKKSEIVRLNHRNYLKCQLHEHHDHMKEVVKSLFEKISTGRNIIVADELSEKFAIKTAFSLSAYDNTVICDDCNKADGDAKIIVGAHKSFSFSPKEIGEFVKATPNQEHEIDEDIANLVWQRVKPIFQMRIEMAEKFATIAAEKKDWYQPSERTAKQTERGAKHFFEANGLLELDKYEPERLLYNTEPFKGKNNSWRIKKNPVVKNKPSSNELNHLSGTRGKYWNRYDENWSCPSCNRNKYDCVRPSKKNPWVFEVKSAPLFQEHEQVVNYSADPMCADCIDTSINLGREVIKEGESSVMFSSSVITLAELSRFIIARPHSKHAYNNDVINNLLPDLVERACLIEKLETKKKV